MARKYELHGEAAGGRHTKEYAAWVKMRYRCEDPQHPSFAAYGGRGIKVCERWRCGFSAFIEDMGRSPPGASIHRVDNDGDYDPGNCVWADRKTQQVNRRNSIWVTHNGERMPIGDAAASAGLTRMTVYARIKAGWPEDRWLEPASKERKHCERLDRSQPSSPPSPSDVPVSAGVSDAAKTLFDAGILPISTQRAVERALGLTADSKPSRSKERRAYEAMRSRCYNPNNASWDDYGGRGITVCNRWLESYEAFLEDMGDAPAVDSSLERIRVNEDYSPNNCRWATWTEQQRNRRNTPFVTFNGKRIPLSEAAEKAGIAYITVHMRWRRGWPEERLFEPPTHRRSSAEWVREGSAEKRRTSKIHRKPPRD